MDKFSKYAKTFASDVSQSVFVDFFITKILPFIMPFCVAFMFSVLAYFTEAFLDLAPFSYGLAFLIGFVFYSLGWYIWGQYRISVAKSRILELSVGPKSSINPLNNHFENQRIYISDFFVPYDPVIKGKTFLNCEIMGPFNIIIPQGGRGTFDGVDFYECDFIEAKPNAFAHVGIGLFDVSFKNCKFYKFTIIVPPDIANQLRSIKELDINWVTK
ncbi:MAG: hypothetical protein IPH06_13890 [Alphaproteobacteria bacterium]|nr:hypothetical protein [Alphaproteobacteria bacterium]